MCLVFRENIIMVVGSLPVVQDLGSEFLKHFGIPMCDLCRYFGMGSGVKMTE
jgi:hypothetical protein